MPVIHLNISLKFFLFACNALFNYLLLRRSVYWKRIFTLATKYVEIYSPYEKSKQADYDKYVETNWNYIKNTWKGIKSLTSLKTVASNVLSVLLSVLLNVPTVLFLDNSDTITNHYGIANTFNCFGSIAETMNNSTKYSHKHLSDYPTNESGSTIFLQPSCKEEIPNTISSLNSNKASGSTLRLKFW